jgi:hypothetical protein
MKTIEAAVVVGADEKQVLYWHLPPNRHSVALPDSRKLWEVYWENRRSMSGQAHSHPGTGWPGPSWEDITSYEACESGLGRRYKWWIASMDRLVVVQWAGPGRYDYKATPVHEAPPWVDELRRHSVPEENPNQKEIQP